MEPGGERRGAGVPSTHPPIHPSPASILHVRVGRAPFSGRPWPRGAVRGAARCSRCPRCCSRRPSRSSSSQPRGCRGTAPRERPRFASWRKSRLRGWHESGVVLPAFPPPVGTPLSSRSCGFDAGTGAPPSKPGALAGAAPEQAGRGSLAGEGRAAGGLRGAFPSHARLCLTPLCRPAPGEAGTARPRLPCPGWGCLIPYLRELGF